MPLLRLLAATLATVLCGLALAAGNPGAAAGDPAYRYDRPVGTTTAAAGPSVALSGDYDRPPGRSSSYRVVMLSSLAAEGGAGSLAGRDALGRFTGAGGYGAEAEAQGLSNYELATGQTVIRDQVRASLAGGGPGRFYDGLVRNADGTYTGIEVKSGTASLTAPQRAFDSAVNGGEVARASLNGQPIDITSTELVRVR